MARSATGNYPLAAGRWQYSWTFYEMSSGCEGQLLHLDLCSV